MKKSHFRYWRSFLKYCINVIIHVFQTLIMYITTSKISIFEVLLFYNKSALLANHVIVFYFSTILLLIQIRDLCPNIKINISNLPRILSRDPQCYHQTNLVSERSFETSFLVKRRYRNFGKNCLTLNPVLF